LIGDTPAMRAVKADIGRFAPLAETVLVTGETGTGKELVARLLHDRSPRARRPFLAVNCAAISDTLLESELFGHVKGAFTGAERAHDGLLVAAGAGTVFFDEIGSMSPRLQGAMLRVLEERKVRPVGGTKLVPIEARLVAATNQPLEDLVKAGTFRQDLYYRLARLEIRLPPLRERREDILPLVRHFLHGYFEGGNIAVGDDLLEEMKRHDWPGNVRELANAVQRMVIMAGDVKVLGAELFRGQVESASPARAAEAEGSATKPAAEGPRRPVIRGARGRLAALRRLFDEHRELSRGDAAHLLGCAGGTAAKLLAILEAEGAVTRVEPTPVPRTHFFRLKATDS
jgi:transcriptional regulator with PAS, ATPase and Fis domain